MVCTEDDLSNWRNFPKGLRVLLLDTEADTTSKLQSMDYIVTNFADESEALSAYSKRPESFHIAIVEVNASDKNKSFEFLEAAKDLPTIMTSRDHCLTTMMKCIALGAVEFLHKPLSEDRLENIWQHVVHRAFNDGRSNVSGSLKPVKESVVSMLHLELGKQEENDDDMRTDEKDPAPSTPQPKQGSSRLVDDGDCQENVNCSMEENVNSSNEKENTEDRDIGESKSVETTNRASDGNNVAVKEEGEGETDDVKGQRQDTDPAHCLNQDDNNNNKDCRKSGHLTNDKPSGVKNVSGNKSNRKKVDWTPELHKKFVKAVEQLGVEQAIPSRILDLMKVEGLTRHNVASHLQKFRMHRRNILPKEDHDHHHHHHRRWIQPRGHNHHLKIQTRYGGLSNRHVMAYPAPPMYHVWAHPTWPPTYPPPVHGQAWGCPVGPPAIQPCHTCQNLTGPPRPPSSFSVQPEEEEVIDKVVKEAMSKPWLTLPPSLPPPISFWPSSPAVASQPSLPPASSTALVSADVSSLLWMTSYIIRINSTV
ncbi:PREDICTED: two-component response regulator-like APRR2 [Tarenaya hassleriana]|uniref:two-component response regulator-like APRR2 n=1 Tax=Tarenaya hassleriana TaxID=28532 RepID=UPI00053C0956|nr:PREDICTED: two-component response regulator-like APRR2 [Tarenaya hassleriana]XP_010559286.1 PREDICTED: two-component response regulator-like APRR2 [Tarenaya hassleriana]